MRISIARGAGRGKRPPAISPARSGQMPYPLTIQEIIRGEPEPEYAWTWRPRASSERRGGRYRQSRGGPDLLEAPFHRPCLGGWGRTGKEPLLD